MDLFCGTKKWMYKLTPAHATAEQEAMLRAAIIFTFIGCRLDRRSDKLGDHADFRRMV